MCIDAEKGNFRSGCVGGGKPMTDFRHASSGIVVSCTGLGGAASATCPSELADRVGTLSESSPR